MLDAERNLFNAELQQTQTRAATLTNLVNLYMAMGGGWVVQAEQMSVPAPASGPSPAQPTTPEPVAQAPQ